MTLSSAVLLVRLSPLHSQGRTPFHTLTSAHPFLPAKPLDSSLKRGPETPEKDVSNTHSTCALPFSSPTDQTPPFDTVEEVTRNLCDSLRSLQEFLPSTSRVLSSDDVQIVGTTARSPGSFSDIWEGTFNETAVVIKSFRCHSFPGTPKNNATIRFRKEAMICSLLSHANIVPFIGVYSTPKHPFSLVFETMNYIDLNGYLAQRSNLNKPQLLLQIARGLEYMHDQGIIHGDLKMSNILVDENGAARIDGLGSAFILQPPASWSNIDLEKLPWDTTPETPRPARACDMFAFGLLAWEVLTGQQLPTGGSVDMLPRVIHPEMSLHIWKMIQKCWNKDPGTRVTAADVVSVLEGELQRSSQSTTSGSVNITDSDYNREQLNTNRTLSCCLG